MHDVKHEDGLKYTSMYLDFRPSFFLKTQISIFLEFSVAFVYEKVGLL